MTDALKVKKFADECISEHHWDRGHLTVFIYIWHLDKLCELLGSSYFSDDGLDCVLKDRYLVIPDFQVILEDWFDLYGDDIDAIFPERD